MKRYAIVNYDRIGNPTPGCLEEYVSGQLVKYEDCKSIKEENDKLKARVADLENQNSNLQRNVAALVEIVQNCGCEDEEPANEG